MYLLGLEIFVSLGIDSLVFYIDLEDLHVGDGFYDAIGDLVPWLRGIFFGIDIFTEFVDVGDFSWVLLLHNHL